MQSLSSKRFFFFSMCIRVHLCVVCAFVQCLGRPGDGLGALELKLGGCEGGEARAVPSWRRVCS